MAHRSQLTPFFKLIMKALRFELENDTFTDDRAAKELKPICDEIIAEARSLSTTSTPSCPQTSTLNTLQMEHDQLKLNLK